MNSTEFVTNSLRDAIVIDALLNAEIAMSLTNGCTIWSGEVHGIVRFDGLIAKLRTALVLLGGDNNACLTVRNPAGDPS